MEFRVFTSFCKTGHQIYYVRSIITKFSRANAIIYLISRYTYLTYLFFLHSATTIKITINTIDPQAIPPPNLLTNSLTFKITSFLEAKIVTIIEDPIVEIRTDTFSFLNSFFIIHTIFLLMYLCIPLTLEYMCPSKH